MAGNFIKYASDPYSAADMPVDQHELLALCAPRLLLVSSGVPEADKWQDLIGMHLSASLASPVYDLVCDGGHEPGPNWPYFLDLFDLYVVKK